MRVTRFFAVSAAIACGIVLPFLIGCGGSDDNVPTPNPSATASPAIGVSRAYAGNWRGSWEIGRESTATVAGGVLTFDISENGTFTANLTNSEVSSEDENYVPIGVFAAGSTQTINGTVNSSGYFTGQITVDNVTNTIYGSLVRPVGVENQLRGTLVIVDQNVQLSNVIALTPAD